MKIGIDIGGVISKYPEIFWSLLYRFKYNITSESCGDFSLHLKDVYIITDIPKENVIRLLQDNSFIEKPNMSRYDLENVVILPENIYCANYEKYGNMAKAILIKELGIDIFIDDFDGYLQWDSSLGPQPLLLKVMPDAYKPYWADTWKCNGGDFGRRKYVK